MRQTSKSHSRAITRRGKALLSLALLLGLSALGGCQADEGERHIGRQLLRLHEQMNGEDTAAIWNAADDGFRQAISQQEFKAMFVRNHRRLGDAGGGIMLESEVYSTFKGTYIMQTLITDFANDPEAREHLVWFGKDGNFRLYRYDVSSKLLK